MAEDVARRAHAILRQAAELEGSRREAFVAEACAGDDALRRVVMRMVSALDRATTFLERPALAAAPGEPQPDVASEAIGTYRIVGVIGSGGMATVYEAIQDRPQRRVALKVMNRGLLGTSAVQRFQFETEVLARLRHPGIAQILEAGTHDDGRGVAIPFFAMEYVEDARPITIHAVERRQSREARLAMFAEVCDAVQHGHQNGVVHRDIKPGNVLVDGAGRPKVIDFGIARSTDPEHARITLEADAGRIIGTLNSMSPEQCAGGDVDARTDVYSLGVLLYELLCGRPPHDLAGVALVEALRIVQQDAPRRPTAVEPTLDPDLEAIVLRAMAKEPGQRYPSAAALAADVRHYLDHEPIEARPPTLFTQCRLFARRNRGLVAAVASLAVVLLLSSMVSGAFAYRASREADLRAAAESRAIAQRDEARRQAYAANIAGGLAGLKAGEFEQARHRLAAAPESLRGWEWGYLSRLAAASERTLRAKGELDDLLDGIGLSEDGEVLATVARNGRAGAWRVATAELVAIAEGTDETAPPPLALAPDGTRLALALRDGSGRRWITIHDIAADCEVERLGPLPGPTTGLAWSASTLVACAGGRGFLWNLAGLRAEDDAGSGGASDSSAQVLRGGSEGTPLPTDQPGGVTRVALSHDGSKMATWAERTDGQQRHWTPIWVRRGDGERHLASLAYPGHVHDACFSRDGALLAAGGFGGRVLVWSTATGDLLHDLAAGDGTTTTLSLAFSPDGSTLACGQVDRRILLWSMEDGGLRDVLRGHGEAISGLVFGTAGDVLHSTSWDRTVRTWTLATSTGQGGRHEAVTRLEGHRDHVLAVAVSPDGALLATGSRDDALRLWSLDDGRPLAEFDGGAGDIFATAFSPGGDLLAFAGDDRRVHLRTMPELAEAGALEGHEGTIWTVAVHPAGELMASGGNDQTVRLWDIARRREVAVLRGHTARVIEVAFSPDGRLLASASRDGTVRLWEVPSGREVAVLEGHLLDVFAVLFSRDGRFLFSGCRDQTVRVWDVASGACLRVLDGHGQFVTCLALNPEGTRLAAGSWFGEVVLWDVSGDDPSTFGQVASFRGHDAPIRDVKFTPDGDVLITASYDRSVHLHDSGPPGRDDRAAGDRPGAEAAPHRGPREREVRP